MNIYYSYTLDWPKPAVDRAVTQLPPLRREKAERYRRFEGRRESTAAVLLTLHALEASVTCSDEPMWREEPLSELIGQKDWPRLAAALDWSPAPEGKPFPNGLVLSRGRETLRRPSEPFPYCRGGGRPLYPKGRWEWISKRKIPCIPVFSRESCAVSPHKNGTGYRVYPRRSRILPSMPTGR